MCIWVIFFFKGYLNKKKIGNIFYVYIDLNKFWCLCEKKKYN